jgi:hypothetical protein
MEVGGWGRAVNFVGGLAFFHGYTLPLPSGLTAGAKLWIVGPLFGWGGEGVDHMVQMYQLFGKYQCAVSKKISSHCPGQDRYRVLCDRLDTGGAGKKSRALLRYTHLRPRYKAFDIITYLQQQFHDEAMLA